MSGYSLERMVRVCTAITAEKDADALLALILDEAMDYTAADGGTVYVREPDALRFHTMVTRSMGVRMTGADVTAPPVPLARTHVAACAALDNRSVNIADVYTSEEFDFTGAQRYDALNGYRTQSMLVVPLEDERGRVIGAMQLINAQDECGAVVPFAPEQEGVVAALASLAATVMNQARLSRALSDLLHDFVRVMVGAVDVRSPYNANHTKSMVAYAERFIDWLEGRGTPWFAPEERDPFLMSVWLHDIGKLVIPLEVMDKPTRLGAAEDAVMHRIEVGRLAERIRALEHPDEAQAAHEAASALDEARALIAEANVAGFLPDETIARLQALDQVECLDAEGVPVPLLTPSELEAITVPRGTLTAAERRTIESHVEYTAALLAQMTFSEDYARVPGWASAHHEFLNGSGYPERKTAEQLPREVRLLTILDIYDALTAEDRPYKPPMPPERAFSILESMVEEGKLDGEVLALFRESGAWRREEYPAK